MQLQKELRVHQTIPCAVIAAVVIFVVTLLAVLEVCYWPLDLIAALHVELDSPEPSYTIHIVQPGDTLWSIARLAYPGKDTATAIRRIMSASGLVDDHIEPYQVLKLPTDI